MTETIDYEDVLDLLQILHKASTSIASSPQLIGLVKQSEPVFDALGNILEQLSTPEVLSQFENFLGHLSHMTSDAEEQQRYQNARQQIETIKASITDRG